MIILHGCRHPNHNIPHSFATEDPQNHHRKQWDELTNGFIRVLRGGHIFLTYNPPIMLDPDSRRREYLLVVQSFDCFETSFQPIST